MFESSISHSYVYTKLICVLLLLWALFYEGRGLHKEGKTVIYCDMMGETNEHALCAKAFNLWNLMFHEFKQNLIEHFTRVSQKLH